MSCKVFYENVVNTVHVIEFYSCVSLPVHVVFYTRFSFNQDYSFYHEAFLKVMWHNVIPYVYFSIIVHTFIPSNLYNTFIRCHRRGLSTWTK